MFKKWWNADAEWWQFWYPASGSIGGIIAGVIIGIIFLVTALIALIAL